MPGIFWQTMSAPAVFPEHLSRPSVDGRLFQWTILLRPLASLIEGGGSEADGGSALSQELHSLGHNKAVPTPLASLVEGGGSEADGGSVLSQELHSFPHGIPQMKGSIRSCVQYQQYTPHRKG